MHLVLGVILIILFLIPRIWAKRINLFIAAINLAWSIRNYILLATCFMGECPQIKAGLILSIFLSTAIFIMTLLPDLRQIEKNKAWYLEDGYMEAVKTKAVRKIVNQLCWDIRPDAVALVNAFDIPESCLAAPIAAHI